MGTRARVPLSPTLLTALREYYRRMRPKTYLFPGQDHCWHILRHTFCSHLAMRGAPARAIQELAGHQDLGTTQRSMQLSPAALDAAIRLLETGTDTARSAVEKEWRRRERRRCGSAERNRSRVAHAERSYGGCPRSEGFKSLRRRELTSTARSEGPEP